MQNRFPLIILSLAALMSACGGGNNDGTADTTKRPSAPTNVTVTGGHESIELSWIGSPGATQFNVYWSASAGVTPQNGNKVVSLFRQVVIRGLTNGTTYYAVVTAQNSQGESQPSAQVQTQAVATLPARVSGISATPSESQALVEWDIQPDADSYTVFWRSRSGPSGQETNVVASPFVIDGLTNDVTYTINVGAVNSAGAGVLSYSVTAVPLGPVLGWTPQTQINEIYRAGGSNLQLHDVDINDNGVAAVVYDSNSASVHITVSHTVSGPWSEPIVLEIRSGSRASVAITPNDDIHVAYHIDSGGMWVQRFSAGVWSDRERLNDEDRSGGNDVHLAADGIGNVFATWQEQIIKPAPDSEQYVQIWARRFDGVTETWGPAVMVNEEIGRAWLLSVDTSASNWAIVTWLQDTLPYDKFEFEGGPSGREVYASQFDGVAWQPGISIGRQDMVDWDRTELVSRDTNSAGFVVVGWRVRRRESRLSSSLYQLEAARYDAPSGQWSAPESILDTSSGMIPEVTIDAANECIIAWRYGTADRIDSSTFDPVASLWGPITRLPPNTGYSSTDSQFEEDDAGNFALVWSDDFGEPTGLYVSWLRPGSTDWTDPDHIGGRAGHQFMFKMTRTGHAIVATVAGVEMHETSKAILYTNIYSP